VVSNNIHRQHNIGNFPTQLFSFLKGWAQEESRDILSPPRLSATTI